MINLIDPVDAWHLKRWTKITASEWWKLMPSSTGRTITVEVNGRKIIMWTQTGWTYIETKVMEMETQMQERPYLDEFKNFMYGKAEELPAFEDYVSVTRNTSMNYYGSWEPVFIPYQDDAGCSPDGADIDPYSLSKGGLITHGAEIKCPINPVVHSRYRRLKDQWELKKEYPNIYCQIQSSMLCNPNAQSWDFCSFDSRVKLKSARSKIITCKRDKAYISSADVRLTQAIKDRNELYFISNPRL